MPLLSYSIIFFFFKNFDSFGVFGTFFKPGLAASFDDFGSLCNPSLFLGFDK